ncbi:response regulator [Pseudomonas sp. NFX98]|uniref:response regulator n=1 Tax=Pseudomonas sp. NFX98 TaxID=3399122 RepID=UPI0039FBB810
MSKIVIADEQPLFRHGVRQILEAQGHSIVAELDDGADALRQTLNLAPSLLILDLALPRLGGLEVIRRLRKQASKIPILVLTAQNSEHFAGLSLQAGGTGFISKQDDSSELREAVRTLLHGHSYFPSRLVGNVAPQIGIKAEEAQLGSLSARELTVLRYLASGRSNKDIADELALSDRTVSTYKARLQRKLNVDSLAEVLEIAWRQGMIASIDSVAEVTGANNSEQERFHQIFDAMPMPVSLRDVQGYLLACNRQYLEFHGVTREQAVGMRIIDSSVLAPEEALRLHQDYLQAVALGQPFSTQLVLRYRDRQMTVRSWGVPLHDAQGALTGMLCSTVDITEQDQQISSLTRAREQRRSLSRTRTLFLHDAGEQLMAQLGDVIKSVHRVCHQQPDNALLSGIQSTVLAVQEHIQVLLDVVRIERGTLVLMPRADELNELTRHEVDDFNRKYPAAQPLIVLHPDSPPANVWVDPNRFRQMLRSMFKYCLDLGLQDITLQVQLTPSPQAELLWQLSVAPGPASRAEGLADYLTQNDINPQLALCTRLIILMSGELLLEPPSAEGSLAIIRLRLSQAL